LPGLKVIPDEIRFNTIPANQIFNSLLYPFAVLRFVSRRVQGRIACLER